MKSVIVIPARYESTRLPRKMLLAASGKPLVQHTFESASKSQLAEHVVVATDHEEIESEVERFGGKVILTSVDHQSGTDRLVEVANRFAELGIVDPDIVVNVQGDEPEIEASAIDQLIRMMGQQPKAFVGTLATPITSAELLDNPSCVKVVVNGEGRALYFSRSRIPGSKDAANTTELLEKSPPAFLQHVGIYAYRCQQLLEIPQLPTSQLEEIESLEQLRFLAAGWPIYVAMVETAAKGIDTLEDYELFVKRQAN